MKARVKQRSKKLQKNTVVMKVTKAEDIKPGDKISQSGLHPTEERLGIDPAFDEEVTTFIRTKPSTDIELAEHLGERIRKAMENLEDMSQEALSQEIGCTRVNVNRIIMGRQFPSIPLLIKISKSLGVGVDYLLGIRVVNNDGPQPIDTLRERVQLQALVMTIIARLSGDKLVQDLFHDRYNKHSKYNNDKEIGIKVKAAFDMIIRDFKETIIGTVMTELDDEIEEMEKSGVRLRFDPVEEDEEEDEEDEDE